MELRLNNFLYELPKQANMHIQELHLFTNQLASLQNFYTKVLEFSVLEQDTNQFSLQCGTSKLVFKSGNEPAFYHFAFNIPPLEFLSAYSWLKERVELLQHEGNEIIDFPNWNAKALYFLDPANNIVEFIARRDLTNYSRSSFSSQSILSISEIGFPSEKISEKVKLLKEKMDIPHYWGDQEHFSAVGDPNGLIILVNYKTRKWFLTNIYPAPFPLNCTIQQGENSFNLSIPWTLDN